VNSVALALRGFSYLFVAVYESVKLECVRSGGVVSHERYMLVCVTQWDDVGRSHL